MVFYPLNKKCFCTICSVFFNVQPPFLIEVNAKCAISNAPTQYSLNRSCKDYYFAFTWQVSCKAVFHILFKKPCSCKFIQDKFLDTCSIPVQFWFSLPGFFLFWNTSSSQIRVYVTWWCWNVWNRATLTLRSWTTMSTMSPMSPCRWKNWTKNLMKKTFQSSNIGRGKSTMFFIMWWFSKRTKPPWLEVWGIPSPIWSAWWPKRDSHIAQKIENALFFFWLTIWIVGVTFKFKKKPLVNCPITIITMENHHI